MINSKLKKQLKLWTKNELITKEQSNNILTFMKERQKETFFRLIKWFMIIGAFWLVFGIIATIINILELDIFHKIFENLCVIFSQVALFIFNNILLPINDYIVNPICSIVKKLFGENSVYFWIGLNSFIFAGIIYYINSKIKPGKNIDNLNLTDEQKNIIKTNWALDAIFCIFLSGAFCAFNMLLIPHYEYHSYNKIIPLWNIIGAISFISMAYGLKKNLYLVFGIYFVALSVGMFSGYDLACYWIGVSRPIIQILVGIILLLVGYITQLKINIKEFESEDSNNYVQEKFISTYNWSGLLLLFIALWVASFFGFDLNLKGDKGGVAELWFANLLFIAASVGIMFYGAKSEQKIFFNYGLIFLIIETYTVICGRLLTNLPAGIAALLFGGLLIGTGKIIQRVYLKKVK